MVVIWLPHVLLHLNTFIAQPHASPWCQRVIPHPKIKTAESIAFFRRWLASRFNTMCSHCPWNPMYFMLSMPEIANGLFAYCTPYCHPADIRGFPGMCAYSAVNFHAPPIPLVV